MKAAYILVLLPLALASPFGLERRADNFAQIQAALQKAATDSATFKSDLDQIPDNGPITSSEEIKLINDSNAIQTDVNNANNACKTTSNFSSSESQTGYNSLSSLEAQTKTTLQDLVAHKQALSSAGIISVACNNLKKLKSTSDTLGKCLASHSSAAIAKKAPALQKKFDADFTSAETGLGC